MQHIHNEPKTQQKNVSPLAAGLTGIVIGAAGAAAIVLSDQETRKKASKKATQIKNDLQKWSTKTIQDIQHRGEDMKAASKETLDDQKTTISREIKERLDETDTSK